MTSKEKKELIEKLEAVRSTLGVRKNLVILENTTVHDTELLTQIRIAVTQRLSDLKNNML